MIDLSKTKIPRPLLYVLAILIIVVALGGGYLYLKKEPSPPEEPPEDTYVVDLMDVSYPRGTVKAISSSKITIKTDGKTQTFVTNKETTVVFQAESLQDVIEGKNEAALGDVKVGDEVGITVKVLDDGAKWAGHITILKEEGS